MIRRAAHHESLIAEPRIVHDEPDDFPQTLVPPANALPLKAPHREIATIADSEANDTRIVEPQSLISLDSATDEASLSRDESGEGSLKEVLEVVLPDAKPLARTRPKSDLPGAIETATRPTRQTRPTALLQSGVKSSPATVPTNLNEGQGLEEVFGDELLSNDTPSPADSLPEELLTDDPPAGSDAAELPEAEDTPPVDTDSDASVLPESTPDTPELKTPPSVQKPPVAGPPVNLPEPTDDRFEPDPADNEEGDEVVEYNGRDCARERVMLQSAWEEMRRTPLKAISLDISPSLEPTGTPEEAEESRRENMERAPARVWRSRDGAVIAQGKMVDFRNSQVLVEDQSGEMRKLSWYQLSNDDLCFVSAWWELPTDATAEHAKYAGRNWAPMTMTWVASALCHKPLYFEEVQLERYGHSAPPLQQAAISGVHFFGSIFFLPYQMGVNPPNECQYALGYYRPGSCAPWLLPAVPLSARGARMQASALAGAIIWYP